jgi:glycosyltransferase involved in cell wall biosynthesis
MSVEISVFTATYNRADTLHRVWNSLRQQTVKNFEWVIIDDGSSDNTREVVEQFAQNSDFDVRYYWQTNRGKHTAYNAFAGLARGDLYCSIDSDDEVLPQCLERMLFHFNDILAGERTEYAGIMCLAQDQHGELIGDEFWPDDFRDDVVGVLLRHRKLGDKGGLNRLDVLREFPFPEDVERVYVPESYHIHGYTTKYKTKFVNEILIQPWTDRREDHLSNRLGEVKNYAGTAYGLLAWPKYSMRHFWRNPKLFVAVTSAYIAVALASGKSLRRQYHEVESLAGRTLWLPLIPLGLIRYYTMRRR